MESTAWLLIAISSLATAGAVLLAIAWLIPLWDSYCEYYLGQISPMLDSLSLRRASLAPWLRLWGVAMIVVFWLFVFYLRMLPLAPAAVYFVYIAPRMILAHLIERRKRMLRDQMVQACQALANTTRAGLSLAQGLETVAEESPQPLASELRRIVYEYRRGRPLAEAIRDTKQRLRLESFSTFAAAVLVSLERGGRISEMLDGISASLAENQRLERKLEAETASGRRAAWVMGLFPFVFLAGFCALDIGGTALIFETIVGQIVLLAVIALVYGAARWSLQILRLEA
jgi:Flp pilus assembly protein TadB